MRRTEGSVSSAEGQMLRRLTNLKQVTVLATLYHHSHCVLKRKAYTDMYTIKILITYGKWRILF